MMIGNYKYRMLKKNNSVVIFVFTIFELKFENYTL